MLLGEVLFCSASLLCSGLDAPGPLPHSLVHTSVIPVRKDLPSALLGARYTVVINTELSFQPPCRFLPPRAPSPHLSENVVSESGTRYSVIVAYLESLAGLSPSPGYCSGYNSSINAAFWQPHHQTS